MRVTKPCALWPAPRAWQVQIDPSSAPFLRSTFTPSSGARVPAADQEDRSLSSAHSFLALLCVPEQRTVACRPATPGFPGVMGEDQRFTSS
jgi:hypothetical protein